MNLRSPRKPIQKFSISGFTLIEAVVGMSMLSLCTLTLIPVLQSQAIWRQELRRQQFAQITLQNIAVELQADPPDEVTVKTLEPRLALSLETLQTLPHGKVEAIVDAESEPVGDRVQLHLSWGTKQDVPRSQVGLVVWLYKRGVE